MRVFFLAALLVFSSCATRELPKRYLWEAKFPGGQSIILNGTVHQDLGELNEIVKKTIQLSDLVLIEMTQKDSLDLNTRILKKLIKSKAKKNKVTKALSQKAQNSLLYIFEETNLIDELELNHLVDTPEKLNIGTAYLILFSGIQKYPFLDFLPSKQRNKYQAYAKKYPRTLSDISRRQDPSNIIIDHKIEQEAKAYGVPVVSMDSGVFLEEKLNYIFPFGRRGTLNIIEFFLGDKEHPTDMDLGNYNKITKQITESYLEGNDKIIAQTITEIKDPNLLEVRNKMWIKDLTSIYLKKFSNIYFAAGVGHFFGKDNLLTLLKNQGAQIKRLY